MIKHTDGIERRVLDVEVEFRADEPDKAPTVRGYAAVFGKASVPLGGFTEVIERGAFADALKEGRSVPLLIEHDGLALADTETKTLTLSEDDTGLRFAAELDASDPDTQRVLPKLKRGTLRKMSFGFTIARGGDEWNEDEKTGAITRTIRKVASLFDVSLVTNPAYPDTAAALRSLNDWKNGKPAEPLARETRKRRLLLSKSK
jgi:uncharacterized protein